MQAPRLLQRLRPNLVQKIRGYAHDNFAPTTLNDIPSPKGSWQKQYDQNQQKYNIHLILGIGVLAGTLAFGQYSGFHEFYNEPPEKPAVVTTYKVDD